MKRFIFFTIIFTSVFNTETKSQVISTIVGGGSGGGSDGWGSGLTSTNAILGNFCGVTANSRGDIYIADKDHSIIRKVDAFTGVITTVAGVGIAGYSGDSGLATSAKINSPGWIAFDKQGSLFFSDRANYRIRKIDTSGIITTIAGTGAAVYAGDGDLAITASLCGPQGICFDPFGNLFITDCSCYRVRKIDTSGIINTVGGKGIMGSIGDGGPADSAEFMGIYGIRSDSFGNIYVADYNDSKVRKIDMSSGIISLVAGNGTATFTGDSTSAILSGISPFDIAVTNAGEVYIADLGNNRIRKVDEFGVIYTIAGNGTSGFSGDSGLANIATLNRPAGLNFDVCGDLLIADNQNHRVREIFYPPTLTIPTILLSGGGSATVGSVVTINALLTNSSSSYVIHWINHGIEFTTTTVPSVTYTKTLGIDSVTARIVPTGYGCYDSTTSSVLTVTSASTGVGNLTMEQQKAYIYPNPVTVVLTISSSNKITEITIVNLLGQTVQNETLNAEKAEISVASLPLGVYFIKITDSEGQKTVRKIVKD